MMRRKDRELTSIKDITAIIESCRVIRVAACADHIPYLVPLNFGYDYTDGQFTFYFHCAGEGKKLDLFRKNNTVCFEMDCGHELTAGASACAYGYNYKSIIGMGSVEIVTDLNDKAYMLTQLMKHQTGKQFDIAGEQAASVTVCRINVTELSAKQRVV